jgi:hypothetical protein
LSHSAGFVLPVTSGLQMNPWRVNSCPNAPVSLDVRTFRRSDELCEHPSQGNFRRSFIFINLQIPPHNHRFAALCSHQLTTPFRNFLFCHLCKTPEVSRSSDLQTFGTCRHSDDPFCFHALPASLSHCKKSSPLQSERSSLLFAKHQGWGTNRNQPSRINNFQALLQSAPRVEPSDLQDLQTCRRIRGSTARTTSNATSSSRTGRMPHTPEPQW